MTGETRRDFLRVAGGIGVVCTGLGLGAGVASAAVTVSGRLVAHDGDPVTGGVVKNYGEGEFEAYTDEEGRFSAETRENARLNITLYKGNRSTQVAPVRNHVPHVYNVGTYTTEDGNTNLGELEVPKGHLVRLRALDSDGEPVRNATPGVRHGGSGIGEQFMSTESDGWAYIDDADFDGIELAERTLLSMGIPTDGGGAYELEEQVRVDGPKTVTFQVGEGVNVSDGGPTESTSTPTTSTTDVRSTTRSATESTETRTATSSTRTTTTESAHRPSDSSMEDREQDRGFLSNGESTDDLGPLDDPLTLTVGGFALSVAGIAHQMIRGY